MCGGLCHAQEVSRIACIGNGAMAKDFCVLGLALFAAQSGGSQLGLAA